MNFELHPNLQKKTQIIELALCKVLLEDIKDYPWILLVPKRENIKKIMDLSQEDQLLLLQELDLAQRILWDILSPTQINVAAIGNKTPQLHIHVIARFEGDPAWPATVWDHPQKTRYSNYDLESMTLKLKEAFQEALV